MIQLRHLSFGAALILFMLGAMAQTGSSGLSGTVLDYTGAPVADAPVRARNAAAGVDARMRSADDGSYSFSDLAPGTYTISVNVSCCAHLPFRRDDVVLVAGEVQQLVINLQEGVSLNTLGDDPETIVSEVRDRQVIPDVPVPQTADGRPDLTGVWLRSQDPFPEPPGVQAWVEDVMAQRRANHFAENPQTYCLPGSPPVPGGSSFFVKFVQRPELLVLLFEGDPGVRQIFLDGRDHPSFEDYDPTWMGHSIGRWEGETLVVDTVGFNDRGWIGTYPRTEAMHTVERYTRTDYGTLQVEFTVEDPGVFTSTWVQNMTWDLAPQEELFETVCEHNRWGQPR